MDFESENLWIVPEPSAISEAVMDDGVPIMLRRHGNPSGPRLVLSHGTGLAIDVYYPFWSLLADRFDFLPDATHALPLEEPEKCASETIGFLEGCGLA